MYELSLFSGAGGGLLGSKLLGWETIGYVENNEYCQKVIAQRIRDGILDEAPIFGDIRTFINQGCADLYRGVTDIITAGFPCQPFSLAGKRKGIDDKRNLWPETYTVIQQVNPRYVLLENVPGVRRYLPVVIRDLRRIGYTVKRPLVVAAAALGAGHIRKRIWLFAYDTKQYGREQAGAASNNRRYIEIPSHNDGCQFREQQRGRSGESGAVTARHKNITQAELFSNPASKRLAKPQKTTEQITLSKIKRTTWWHNEPRLARLVRRPPNRMDRVRAAGNIQVPICMATAFQILSEGIV